MSNASKPRLLVDLQAIEHNFQAVKRLVGEKVDVSAVVKSDAYGLGVDPVVSSLASAGCKSFLQPMWTKQCGSDVGFRMPIFSCSRDIARVAKHNTGTIALFRSAIRLVRPERSHLWATHMR